MGTVKFLAKLTLALVVFTFWSGAQPARSASAKAQVIKVATGLAPLADIIAHVGGSRVKVSCLVPADADPHTYEQTFSALVFAGRADIIFVNGDGLDRLCLKAAKAVQDKQVPVVVLADFIPAAKKNDLDPHYWLEPQFACLYVRVICQKLCQIDPDNALIYRQNADSYQKQIQALDARYQFLCRQLPPSCRRILLYHNSWTYLCRRYGFMVAGVVEDAHDGEPSARKVCRLIEASRQNRVRAIVAEAGHARKILQVIKEEAGIPRVIETYEDALGPPPCNTYLGMMGDNLAKITSACK